MHIDVHALHQGYLRGMTSRGGQLYTDANVEKIEFRQNLWHVQTPKGEFISEIIINASGAWVDEIAIMAGVDPIGIQPKRRTAAIVASPPNLDGHACPMVSAFDSSFYFCADAGKMLISLADETPSLPCDAYPEDYDVALMVENIQKAANFPVTRIERSWAGLRNFAADRNMVVGYDKKVVSFFWLAGQGGYGIQTAPAMAEIAAALTLKKDLPAYIQKMGISSEALSPRRF